MVGFCSYFSADEGALREGNRWTPRHKVEPCGPDERNVQPSDLSHSSNGSKRNANDNSQAGIQLKETSVKYGKPLTSREDWKPKCLLGCGAYHLRRSRHVQRQSFWQRPCLRHSRASVASAAISVYLCVYKSAGGRRASVPDLHRD